MTLAAAGFAAQVFSDTAGVLFGGTVEAACVRLGLASAALSASQRALPRVKAVGTGASVVGVVIGCLLGMGTLLFKDTDLAERLRRQKQLNTLFEAVLDQGHELLGAERCTLFLLDERDPTYVYSKVKTGSEPSRSDLRRCFELYDRNDSGTVGAAELSASLEQLGITFRTSEVEDMMLAVRRSRQRMAREAADKGGGPGVGVVRPDPKPPAGAAAAAAAADLEDSGGGAGAAVVASPSRRLSRLVRHGTEGMGVAFMGDDALAPGGGGGGGGGGVMDAAQSAVSDSMAILLDFEEFCDLMTEQILKQEIHIKLRPGGTKHHVVRTGQVLNVPCVDAHPLCKPLTYKYKYKTLPRNMLIGPILDAEGNVIGLIENYNKQADEGGGGFTKEDEKLLKMMCHHAAIFIRQCS